MSGIEITNNKQSLINKNNKNEINTLNLPFPNSNEEITNKINQHLKKTMNSDTNRFTMKSPTTNNDFENMHDVTDVLVLVLLLVH